MVCESCDCQTPTLGVWQWRHAAPMPKFHTHEAACFDLAFSPAEPIDQIKVINKFGEQDYEKVVNGEVHTHPGQIYFFPTGMCFDIPRGYSVRIFPRSSTPIKYGLMLANSVGVIDSDYVDEIFLMMTPIYPSKIKIGTRLCQAEMIKVNQPDLRYCSSKPPQRGNRTGGFGSTGT